MIMEDLKEVNRMHSSSVLCASLGAILVIFILFRGKNENSVNLKYFSRLFSEKRSQIKFSEHAQGSCPISPFFRAVVK